MPTCKSAFFIVMLALVVFGCGTPPKVIQGNVASYDPSTNLLIVRDEVPPNSEVSLNIQKAEFGAIPELNDLVRVSYKEEGGNKAALRVMNLTRQAEVGKGGSKK